MTPRPVHYGTGLPGLSHGDPEELRREGLDPEALLPDHAPMANELMSEEIGITFHPSSDWEETPPAERGGVNRRYSSEQFGDWEVPRTEHMILKPSRYMGITSVNDWQPGEHPPSEGEPGLLDETRGILRVVTSPWNDHPGWPDTFHSGSRIRPSDVPDLRTGDTVGPLNIPVLAQRLIVPAHSRPPRRAGDPMNKWGGTWPEDETDEEYERAVGHDYHRYQFLASDDTGISRPVREGESSADFTPGHRLGMPALLIEMQHTLEGGTWPRHDDGSSHARTLGFVHQPHPPRLSNISSPGDAIDATIGNAHVHAHSWTPAEAWRSSAAGTRTFNAPAGVQTTYGQYAQRGGGGYLSLTQFANPPERLDPDSAWSGERFYFEPEDIPTDDTNKRNIEFAPDMIRIAHGAWQKQQQDWARILMRGD